MASRPFTIHYPQANGAVARSFPGMVGVPVVFTGRPAIHLDASRFLIDIAYAKWSPGRGLQPDGFRPPTKKTLHATAERLANFLEWVNQRSIDTATCDYRQSVQRYSDEMVRGIWSRNGGPLANSTVNARVLVASSYLRYLADTGRRDIFDVLNKEIIRNYGRDGRAVLAEQTLRMPSSKLKVVPKAINLPNRDQVIEWLKAARQTQGETFYLMARSILEIGLRREELLCFRRDGLSMDRSQWKVMNAHHPADFQTIEVRIEWGAKGRGDLEICPVTGDSKKGGRVVAMPLGLANRWMAYRLKPRVQALAIRSAHLKGRERDQALSSAIRFFLRDNGKDWTGKTFWDAWNKVPITWQGAWHPHMGRHWWACMVLVSREAELVAQGLKRQSLLDTIRLFIQPQLGHLSEATTMTYVRWFLSRHGVSIALDDEIHFDCDSDSEEFDA